MGRRFLGLGVFSMLLIACGGVQIPEHSGYKSDKAKPWKKAKTLKFDDKNEAKVEGDLSYLQMKRATWFAVDLSTPAALDLRLEITPPGDAVNDDFDLAMEVLDPGYRVVSKSDLEEEDAHELNKTRSLVDLAPGRYLIHLYLQGRLDSADFILHAVMKPTSSSVGKSDFPSKVAFPTALAMVPLNDDTPKTYKPVTPVVVTHTNHRKPPTTPTPPVTPPPVTTFNAQIIGMSVVAGGTQITIGRGTKGGAAPGMKGKVNGVAQGAFTLGACTDRACTATLDHITPDQIKGAGSVTIGP